jgi:hypothetical protein
MVKRMNGGHEVAGFQELTISKSGLGDRSGVDARPTSTSASWHPTAFVENIP